MEFFEEYFELVQAIEIKKKNPFVSSANFFEPVFSLYHLNKV
jgi:hypothetical protein